MFVTSRKNIAQIVAIFCLLSFFIPNPCGATDRDVEISSGVSRDSVTIGDEILYMITIKSKPEIGLDSMKLSLDLTRFKIKEHKGYRLVKDKKGNVIGKQEYVITMFDLGNFVIPPARVEYKNADHQIAEASSDSIIIKVNSVGVPNEAKDIKGLKAPFKAKEKSKWFLYLIAGIIGAGILAWAYLHWSGKGVGLPQTPPESRKPAWEIALTQLEELKKSDYIKKGQIKRYYTVLSEIMRGYLERGFGISAIERTTSEIRLEMRKDEVVDKIVHMTIELLSNCDLAKFAKFVPALAQTEEDWQKGYDLVLKTKAQETEPVTVAK